MEESNIEEIKEFLISKNPKFKIDRLEKTEDNTTIVGIDFSEPIELTEEEYDKLYNLLKKLGFYPLNGAENQTHNFIGYKRWVGIDEWGNDDGDKIYVEYVRVTSTDGTKYLIKRIDIEKRAQKYVNEL